MRKLAGPYKQINLKTNIKKNWWKLPKLAAESDDVSGVVCRFAHGLVCGLVHGLAHGLVKGLKS